MFMSARTAFQCAKTGGGGGAAAHTGLTFRSMQTDTSGGSTHTYSSLAVGTAATDRWVIVGYGDSSGGVPSSMTIGGVTATLIVGASSSSSIWAANVPTGTTATVVADGSSGSAAIIGYYTVNMSSGVATQAGEASSGGPAIVSNTVNISANGFCIVFSFNFKGADAAHSIDASFTEGGEAFNDVCNIAISHREVVGAVTGVSVTDTWSTTDAYVGACFASWQ